MEVVSFVDVPYHGWHFNGRNLFFFSAKREKPGKHREKLVNTGKNCFCLENCFNMSVICRSTVGIILIMTGICN